MKPTLVAAALATILLSSTATGSSHREAPLITKYPKVDNTDVYMFHSYEAGRRGYMTILANFQPFQDPAGGPNFYQMDEEALYTIHIDNDGDAREDISFNFRFFNKDRGIKIPVGGKSVAIPIAYAGPFGSSPDQEANRNVVESYALVTTRERDNNPNLAPVVKLAKNLSTGGDLFPKPFDNVGTKTIPEYEAYAARHIQRVAIDGCPAPGRVFVGQRREGFKIAVGEIFDLINLNPLGPRDGEPNDLENKNVTTIALELPISCLTFNSPVIGAWSTASMPTLTDFSRADKKGSRLQQVSRLGNPLVNEVVIGVKDKDLFNISRPRFDGQFAAYVTNPTLPELIQTLFPAVTAPNAFPRTDLVAAFLTGIDGLNQPPSVKPSEMLRLNTFIKPKPASEQSSLGVLGGDLAGFPNGRRPGDDVVDIALRVMMGVLLPKADAPSGRLPYTDGVIINATEFRSTFPYLNTPIPGDADAAP